MTGAHTNSLGAGGLTIDDLNRTAACPRCGASLAIELGLDGRCEKCEARYPALPYGWDLTPPRELWSSEMWTTWQGVQENGRVGYEEDPERNIAVGQREDATAFARFCGLAGLVLDVGCGPQEWPSYFRDYAPGTRFVGVDPLVGERPAGYTQLRALAEHLPFRSGVFDQVLFATTLDHFVDPRAAIAEAARVLAPGGTIDAWIGHKRPGAPSPSVSPEWYRSLVRPPGADDLFHIKRLDASQTADLLDESGLRVIAREDLPVDEFRSNHFFKAVAER